jgi:hypothetical protein
MKPIKKQDNAPLWELRRGTDRFATELPVMIDGVQGLTRNISATGIYFEAEVAPARGSRVSFTVEVMVRGERLKLVCEGEVVRVEQNDGVLGIAAKLENSFFSDAAEVINVKPGPRTRIH